ncbi:AraC family transcriptional regulator [Planctomycetota bacterium]
MSGATQREAQTLDVGASGGTVSTDMVRILLGGAPLAEGKVAEILRLAGIEPSLLGTPQKRISTRQLAMMWSELERAADDPNLGLHLGELRDGLPAGHVLFSAMLNSPTLGQALERYCRFHDIMGDFVQPQVAVHGNVVVLSLSTRSRVTLHRQHVECIFCLLVSILSHLSTATFKGEVRFSHRCPADISEHLRIFGPDVHFAQPRNELAVERTYLELPVAAADEELLGVLEQYAERLLQRVRPTRTWSGKVAELLSRTLCDGKPRLAQVAQPLAISERSLQEKLKEEGTTYQVILDSVRRQLAIAYLAEDKLSLAEIAFVLGYADQSAFSHAFRKWTSDTPLRFRKRNQRSS